jgi:excisionase family DNA binding protein
LLRACVNWKKEGGCGKMVEPYKPLYTVEETATVLMTNTDTVYSLIRKGSLRALKLGRIKIRGSDLEQFIEDYPVFQGEGQAQ